MITRSKAKKKNIKIEVVKKPKRPPPPNDDDEDDVDEHGNIKGLIDYCMMIKYKKSKKSKKSKEIKAI